MPKTQQKKQTAPYHHGDLRTALVACAREIVERDGPDSISLRGVAKAAGVSQAAPYHHFKDKLSLLSAVAADGFRDFTSGMLARVEGVKDPRKRLDRLGLGYVEFAVQRPQLFRLMQGPTFQTGDCDQDLIDARNESAAPLIATVTACLPGASEAQIMKACAGAWSIVHGMAALCSDGRLGSIIDVSDLESASEVITRQLAIERCLER